MDYQYRKCPYSGLKIKYREDWKNVAFSGGYSCSFEIIEDIALHIISSGSVNFQAMKELLEFQNNLVSSEIGETQKYFIIRNYNKVDNYPHFDVKKMHIDFFKKEAHRLVAFIAYDTKAFVRILYTVGQIKIKLPTKFLMKKDYIAAINTLAKLLREHNCYLDVNDIVMNPLWVYTSTNITVKFGCIKDVALLVYGYGSLTADDVDGLTNIQKMIFEAGWFPSKQFYRISDYSNITGGTRESREKLAKSITDFDKLFGTKLLNTYVCGANAWVRAALSLRTFMFNNNIIKVSTVEKAIEHISLSMHSECDKLDKTDIKNSLESLTIKQSDIDSLLSEVGKLTFHEDDLHVESLSHDHPFLPVYEALELALIDKNDLFKTLEKSNEQLEQSLKAAETANSAKSQFLANMSHEIRTPMNAIIGFTELLQQTTLNHAQNDFLHEITSASNILLSLINDILDYSKIEAGRLQLECIPFNILDLFEDCLSLFSPKAYEKGIRLRCLISPHISPIVLGDSLRLRQILINLLANAVKFTQKGEVQLTVNLISKKDNLLTLEVMVSDTGIGMSEDTITKLFSSFIQADASTTRNYGGTGLGLAISKKILDLMGSCIKVESQVSKGSCFSFTLDFEKVETDVDDAHPEELPLAQNEVLIIPTKTNIEETENPNCRILLVDDALTNRKLAQVMLKKLGFTADTAVNGAEALEMSENIAYDIIFMDCQMPIMDGYDATEKIRNGIGKSKNTSIIAITANAMKGDREKCILSGMDDYIAKPLTLENLENAIHTCIHKKISNPTKEF